MWKENNWLWYDWENCFHVSSWKRNPAATIPDEWMNICVWKIVCALIKDNKYFYSFKIKDYAGSVSTISSSVKIIMSSIRVRFSMSRETKFEISGALYFPESHRNLLSFQDIPRIRYHIETMSKDVEYVCIKSERKHIL